jgi:hypothetical protein
LMNLEYALRLFLTFTFIICLKYFAFCFCRATECWPLLSKFRQFFMIFKRCLA